MNVEQNDVNKLFTVIELMQARIDVLEDRISEVSNDLTYRVDRLEARTGGRDPYYD